MPRSQDILALMARAARDPAAPLATGDLAQMSGWSPAHLHRAFRRVAQETPKEWTTRLRIAAAVSMLHESEEPISEIALQAGFSSHEVLTRTLRRELGVTPTAVREAGPTGALHHAVCLCLYHLPLEPRRTPMPIDVDVQTREPQPVLFQRRTVRPEEMQAALAQCLPAVFQHCQANGIAMAGPPFTRYVAMTRGHFTIEAGIPVAGGEGDGEIEAGELPGGEVAVAIHAGPYDTLGDTHGALEAWARQQGREAGPPWESYVTDPGQTPDPADWRTEVCLPLR